MKTRIGVIVRQRHIDRDRCRSPKFCPVALAMKEQLGTDKVKVYADVVWVGLQKYQIPFKARRFILNFNSGFPVDPLAFLMDAVPELSHLSRRNYRRSIITSAECMMPQDAAAKQFPGETLG